MYWQKNYTRLTLDKVEAAKYGLRFVTIGILAAFVHFFILWFLFSSLSFSALLANLLAYGIAFIVSFCGHFKWTFRSKEDPFRAMTKFLLVSLAALLINTLIFYVLIVVGWLHPFNSAVIAFFFSSTFMFQANHHWTFKK